MNDQELLSTMLEVDILHFRNFGRIRDKLSRIGIASRKENRLVQTCHIFQSRGKYYICHFLELFRLDGKESNLTEADEMRRNAIAFLLQSWGLLKILQPDKFSKKFPVSHLDIVPYIERKFWTFKANYTLGKSKKRA